jgi:hypothetical protein
MYTLNLNAFKNKEFKLQGNKKNQDSHNHLHVKYDH